MDLYMQVLIYGLLLVKLVGNAKFIFKIFICV